MRKMREITYAEAVREAQAIEMRRDPDVFIAGEDIGKLGGSFGATKDLWKEFGPRVFDTPISETGIMGLAVGSAAAGLRPCVELMYVDFIGVCLDEIMNQAAKMRYMFGGKAKVPLVMRTCCGAGVRGAAHHSQSLEAILTHVPGLKVIMPSNPADAKGLLISAIRDDNPVMFLEHKVLYSVKGECPEGEYTVPIGKAAIAREGRDVTIVAWSLMVKRALSAAKKLEREGIDAEVVDVRTLVPLDRETIYNSVRKTHKLVIVHEAVRTSGFGAEIAASAAEDIMEELDAPVKRVTAPDTCIPSSPILEDAYMPDEQKIMEAVRSLL
jgi:pyruvate/2-oxoglutarate/acetoin dehydrogenase E1 component